MATVCAIYGYEFTREFTYRGMRFVPRYALITEAHDKARDLAKYHLTGLVVIDSYVAESIFCLEAVLSFIEHLDVIISDPFSLDSDDYFSQFPAVARTAQRNNGGGAVLLQDGFFDNMRADFICLAMDRLADERFCEDTGWRILFFKATEKFRQRRPFLDISYYLLFSGLETYVRRTLGAPHEGNIAKLIAKRLQQLDFNIDQFRPNDLKRSADSYARVRNALFHNSSLDSTRKFAGAVVHYRLTDYYPNLLILVNLVVLRGAGFNHPRFHWDSWITMQR